MTNPTQLIPNKQSSSQTWIQWHKAMKRRYGKKEANLLFTKAWDMRGGAGSSASTNELRTYMKDNGIKFDTTTMESITDTTYEGLDAVGDFFTMGKYMSIAVGVIVVGGLGMLIFNIAKQPIKSAKAIGSLTPMGRGSKMLK
jgi:hypothetical protein